MIESRRAVFRRIAQRSHVKLPVYHLTPLYDRTLLAGLESNVQTVSKTWFGHDNHDSVEQFVCELPIAYFGFEAHNCYARSTRYEMDTLFRVFVLKECHGWEHETALIEYLECRPALCEQLGLETVPDQSTLWRSWHKRFTAELCGTVETVARTILIKAQNAGVAVPREPERRLSPHGDEEDEPDLDDQAVLDEAATVTDHVSRVVFPAFSLDRGEAVRFTRTRTGDCRRIWGSARIWPPTRVLAASSTSQTETGRR